LSTKIHALCDALGNPLGFYLTPGQCHDLDGADELLPKVEAEKLIADKAYFAERRVFELLEKKGIEPVIPPRKCDRKRLEFDSHLYKARHLIENFFAKLKQYRAIATRFDKTAVAFLGAVHLAASIVWLA